MTQKKVIDPVEDQGQEGLELEDQAIMAGIMDGDINFHQVPEQAAKQPHPFDGYPFRKVQIGTYKDQGKEKPLMVHLSSLVMLTPGVYVHKDPSGENVSHTDPITKVETIQNLDTYHNRVVRDSRGNNTDIVFDRKITLNDGRTFDRVAIVEDHTARAQLIYQVDKKTGKVRVDRRYGVFDLNQLGRLRRVFNGFHFQQTASERAAEKFYKDESAGAEG
jgi:hypothetical protein